MRRALRETSASVVELRRARLRCVLRERLGVVRTRTVLGIGMHG